MSSEQDERRVYSLSDEHFEWADVEDLVPETPEIPEALHPFYPTGETVEDVDQFYIYAYGGEAPHFGDSEQAVEATPQEMAEWRASWAAMGEAQQAFRARLEKACSVYEAAAQEALAELAEAMKPWAPVEATLKARSMELAATLHSHRLAAEEWKAKKDATEQEHLDTIHGPRVIVLYKPKRLSSSKQTDHIAKVHLADCKRRAKLSVPMGQTRHDDEGLRAGEAWHRLTHANEWVRGLYGNDAQNLRVKFCSFCKPWTVFEEHVDGFPRPKGRLAPTLGEVRLTDVPEAWTDKES